MLVLEPDLPLVLVKHDEVLFARHLLLHSLSEETQLDAAVARSGGDSDRSTERSGPSRDARRLS